MPHWHQTLWQMELYVWKRCPEGLKYTANTGVQAIVRRFTPGSFTNYIIHLFKELHLIMVTDLHINHQVICEALYINIPFVNIVIPTNNKIRHSISLIWWLLMHEVLQLCSTIPHMSDRWNVMVNMFFYCDPEEVEKQQKEEAEAKAAALQDTDEDVGAAAAEWDIGSGPQAGNINPGPVSDSGTWCPQLGCESHPGSATDWAAEPATARNWGTEQPITSGGG
ncbi:ribosomal protein S2, flavodoxin-like domain-containing protein [Mycena sp. CBHHK59/15]|nr:ribosomal protein S2, flavodoxin-like domain-containing protein [Mycena sp. CBHHK59/15]